MLRRSWQASSTRTIEPDQEPDVAELAKECLRNAATFAAICQIGKQPSDIVKKLRTWWSTVGKDLLLVESGENVDEEERGYDGE